MKAAVVQTPRKAWQWRSVVLSDDGTGVVGPPCDCGPGGHSLERDAWRCGRRRLAAFAVLTEGAA